MSLLTGDQFISSIEQFDKSSNSWNIPLERDWRIVNTALTLPRYEHTVATIPASQVSTRTKLKNIFLFFFFRLTDVMRVKMKFEGVRKLFSKSFIFYLCLYLLINFCNPPYAAWR